MKHAKIIGAEATFTTVPKIVDVKPLGSQILVEILNTQEIYGNGLIINEQSDMGAPQAYIVAVGPSVDPSWGVKVGDRVLLTGTFTPTPKYKETTRKEGMVEIHNIKAILVEG